MAHQQDMAAVGCWKPLAPMALTLLFAILLLPFLLYFSAVAKRFQLWKYSSCPFLGWVHTLVFSTLCAFVAYFLLCVFVFLSCILLCFCVPQFHIIVPHTVNQLHTLAPRLHTQLPQLHTIVFLCTSVYLSCIRL